MTRHSTLIWSSWNSDASRVPRDKEQDKHENLDLFSNLKGADVLALFTLAV